MLGARAARSAPPHARRQPAGRARGGSAIPATVHVAIGTDTIHHHPALRRRGARARPSLRDFRIFAATLAEARGAVVLNFGSAVLLPEVFLKALSVARNLGADLDGPHDRRTSTRSSTTGRGSTWSSARPGRRGAGATPSPGTTRS